jgi:signal transduction histidine kinase/ActR/RegA family two-component response regulator
VETFLAFLVPALFLLSGVVSWRSTRAMHRLAQKSHDLLDASVGAVDGAVLWCDAELRVYRVTEQAVAMLGPAVQKNVSLFSLLRADSVAPMKALVDTLRYGSAAHVDIPASLGWQSAATPPEPLQGRVVRMQLDANSVYLVALHAVPRAAHTLESRGESAPDVIVQIAHGIAHDFNNLLTTISGRAEMALSHVHGKAAEKQDLEEISTAAARASALARRLLILSDTHALQPRILDANQFIETQRAVLAQLAGTIPLRVVASRDAGSINADPVRLQQVLLALVQNAVEAMQESGSEITLRTERRRTPPKGASAATDAQADYTVIMVQDDGPGLSADAKARLFEPYFTTKQAQRGLGLVTAYGIARQSGGTLDVQSAPGRGTTITIWLPRVSDDADIALVGRLRPLEEQLRQTILVVEDEESVRRLVRVVLEREGYRVLQATNGVEAMRLLEDPSLSLDILLTDVMMPQMGGRELAERLLAVQPDLSVIFMSGYVADRATLTGVAERRAPLLQKPFAIEDLVRVVRSTIEAARR